MYIYIYIYIIVQLSYIDFDSCLELVSTPGLCEEGITGPHVSARQVVQGPRLERTTIRVFATPKLISSCRAVGFLNCIMQSLRRQKSLCRSHSLRRLDFLAKAFGVTATWFPSADA